MTSPLPPSPGRPAPGPRVAEGRRLLEPLLVAQQAQRAAWALAAELPGRLHIVAGGGGGASQVTLRPRPGMPRQPAATGHVYRCWQDPVSGSWMRNRSQPHPAHGHFRFVQLPGDPELRLLRCRPGQAAGHTSLALGGPVVFAGYVRFVRGRVIAWCDGSGHYLPPPSLAPLCVLPLDRFRSAQVQEHIGQAVRERRASAAAAAVDAAWAAAYDPGRRGDRRHFRGVVAAILRAAAGVDLAAADVAPLVAARLRSA